MSTDAALCTGNTVTSWQHFLLETFLLVEGVSKHVFFMAERLSSHLQKCIFFFSSFQFNLDYGQFPWLIYIPRMCETFQLVWREIFLKRNAVNIGALVEGDALRLPASSTFCFYRIKAHDALRQCPGNAIAVHLVPLQNHLSCSALLLGPGGWTDLLLLISICNICGTCSAAALDHHSPEQLYRPSCSQFGWCERVVSQFSNFSLENCYSPWRGGTRPRHLGINSC